MVRHSCDGAGLLETFRAAVANLERHVDEINGLNVYPVPDGDTGSNMLATVRAALHETEILDGAPAHRVAQAISFGSLMGARGNSGVITSQIFRGMAEGLGGKTRFNGLDLAHALSMGTKTAYGAVAKPVEGTILTVIREASAAAVTTAERNNDIEIVLAATVDAAGKAVAKTPSLLAILREAGVVDAGGQGLYRLFEGALLHLGGRLPAGEARDRHRAAASASALAASASALIARVDEGFGYETMFLLQAEPGRTLDIDGIRSHLEAIGESVLVAGDVRAVKVHVHNERPDQVIGYGLALGALSRISVENLDNQARDVRETRAAEFTTAAVTPTDGAGKADPVASTAAADEEATPDHHGPAIVAVVAGEGLRKVYESFGVDQILEGGQSANPSTGELLRIARLARAREVLILPNNPNVRLAAEQAAKMCEDKRLVVVPTRNAAEGLGALLALDPTLNAASNAVLMTDAGRAIQTLQVTDAVRDATIGETRVKRGQTIVLDPDEGLVASANNRTAAVLEAIAKLQPGFELVTLYYGDGADLAEAEAMARLIGDAAPTAEVEVVHGGQPHYRYLIAAE